MFCDNNRSTLVPESTQTRGFPSWTIVDNLHEKVKSEDLLLEQKEYKVKIKWLFEHNTYNYLTVTYTKD